MVILQDQTEYGRLRREWRSLYADPFIKQIGGFSWIMPQNALESSDIVKGVLSRLQKATYFADKAGQQAVINRLSSFIKDTTATPDFKKVDPYYTPQTADEIQNYAYAQGVGEVFQDVVDVKKMDESGQVSPAISGVGLLAVGLIALTIFK